MVHTRLVVLWGEHSVTLSKVYVAALSQTDELPEDAGIIKGIDAGGEKGPAPISLKRTT